MKETGTYRPDYLDHQDSDFCQEPSKDFMQFLDDECFGDPRVAFVRGRRRYNGNPDSRESDKARKLRK